MGEMKKMDGRGRVAMEGMIGNDVDGRAAMDGRME